MGSRVSGEVQRGVHMSPPPQFIHDSVTLVLTTQPEPNKTLREEVWPRAGLGLLTTQGLGEAAAA